MVTVECAEIGGNMGFPTVASPPDMTMTGGPLLHEYLS